MAIHVLFFFAQEIEVRDHHAVAAPWIRVLVRIRRLIDCDPIYPFLILCLSSSNDPLDRMSIKRMIRVEYCTCKERGDFRQMQSKSSQLFLGLVILVGWLFRRSFDDPGAFVQTQKMSVRRVGFKPTQTCAYRNLSLTPWITRASALKCKSNEQLVFRGTDRKAWIRAQSSRSCSLVG